MYTKSLFLSALLAATAVATSHEVMPAAQQPPAAHQQPPVAAQQPPAHQQMPPAPPAAHQQPPAHQQMPPAPPAGQVHKAPPAAQPPVAMGHNAAPPPAGQHQVWQDAGGNGNQLTVYLVSVGDNNGSLKYFPDTVHAAPGSVVQFQFHPKNHTVTESTFDAPCKAKDASLATAQRPGLRSGFVPVTGSEDTTPVYNVLVNDTEPIWIFCGQGPHCMRGMSMVINPPSNPERTILKYQEAAAQLPPPAGAPPAGALPAGAPPAAAPPAASPPSGPPSASNPASPPASPPSPPSGGSSPVSPANPAAAQGSNSGPAPATFTGAASRTSFGMSAALVAGVVAML